MELVPLKVTIGLKTEQSPNGQVRQVADYPPFNDLPVGLRDGMDWSHYVDKFGGWHYDQVSGHQDNDADSPVGQQLGVLLVPEAFAEAACARWPNQCTILAERDAETFYDDRAHVRDPAIREDVMALQAIAAKRAAGLAEDADDRNALDADHPMPGRRRNKQKTFADFKKNRGITIARRRQVRAMR